MKKSNFTIIGIIITAGIISAFVSLLLLYPETSLEQILQNRDCQALQKWENEHIYDDALELSSELKTKIFKLEMECESKAFENIFGK